ncbi:hypothetical protein AGDE_08498 [Angomonas deanei]|uniref:Nuclear transport factor 2 (NTF2) domain containing protein, putative n=1 Tax=Angomonas deanei TaxID=59799 RepID=A0A7G2CNE7_9TRYP|nr:hypothetical protein AGDE_08498 [Angomonas deanei]CAD2220859.1 Nuclear transport factor 2 (NTF2) domain containing protein, putative [Angomonas deanei]|eukprot:EPY32813.1 hypothetical protein AGDE_08498 [Angomonas deanei]
MTSPSLAEAHNVASAFLTQFYNKFVQPGDLGSNLQDLYSDNSYVTLADVDDTQPVTLCGKLQILNHYSNLGNIMNIRKMHVMTADALPAPNKNVQIVCQGVLYVPGSHRIFLHIFTLAPAPFRENTYYIAADYLRFVNVEHEVIPEGAKVVSKEDMARCIEEELRRQELEKLAEMERAQRRAQQQQQQQQQRAAPQHKDPVAAPAATQQRERPPRPARAERPEKEERRPRTEKPKYNKDEKKSEKPSASPAEKKRETPAPRGPKQMTTFVRLCEVPEEIKLSDIKTEVTRAGAEPVDAYWFGKNSQHAVVELPSVSSTTTILRVGTFKMGGKEIKVVSFTP